MEHIILLQEEEQNIQPNLSSGNTEVKHLKSKKLRQLREMKLHSLTPRFFVSLPTHESHEKSHPTGILCGAAQKVHPLISKKIEDLVREGSTDPNEVQRALREYVRNQCSTPKPSPTDRAYYPTTTDIRNHMYKAKVALQLSKFETLLWVHQQQWQRELLTRYGNHISLIDATYRTMKYELPLFFVCVRTNVGYSVVAQFIVQSESAECIAEALNDAILFL